jgi:hypothetical protein
VADGKKFIAFFTFYDFLSVKNMFKAKKKIQNFWSETNFSYMRKVKIKAVWVTAIEILKGISTFFFGKNLKLRMKMPC